jgi:hypothetical protein
MEFSGFRTLRIYQMIWIVSAILTEALALCLPVVNLLIKRYPIFRGDDVSLDIGLLRCFSKYCWQGKLHKPDPEVFNLLPNQSGGDHSLSYDSAFGIENSELHLQISLGSLGTLICFMLAGLMILIQFASLLTGAMIIESWLQNVRFGCGSPITSIVMMIGSLCLLTGFIWYVLITGPILNGGRYAFGFWISLLAALGTLLLSIFAYKDRAVWDFFYQPIPDVPPLCEEKSDAIIVEKRYQSMSEHIVMYPTDDVFIDGNIAG